MAKKKPPQTRSAIEAQIEQFLRRAKQGKAAAAEPVEEVEVLPPEKTATRTIAKSLSHHIDEAMDTSDVTAGISHLGEKIAKTSEGMDAEVHRVLDRNTKLKYDAYEDVEKQRVARADAPAPLVALWAQLRTVGGMSQAVLINEILRRPDYF